MIYLLAFVVMVLAAARATRVLFYDDVAIPLRDWVLASKKKILFFSIGPTPRLGKLIRCYWCSAFWVSFFGCLFVHTLAAAAGWAPWASMFLWPITTFAVAYGASWVLDKEGIADGA